MEAQPPDCVSQEWVDEMEDKISESLLDTECSIQRLYHLCQRILADNSQKSRNAKGEEDEDPFLTLDSIRFD